MFLFVLSVHPRGDREAPAAAAGRGGPRRGPQGSAAGPREPGGRQSQPAALQLDRGHIQSRRMAQPAAGQRTQWNLKHPMILILSVLSVLKIYQTL